MHMMMSDKLSSFSLPLLMFFFLSVNQYWHMSQSNYYFCISRFLYRQNTRLMVLSCYSTIIFCQVFCIFALCVSHHIRLALCLLIKSVIAAGEEKRQGNQWPGSNIDKAPLVPAHALNGF